jgi:hypothetical protein
MLSLSICLCIIIVIVLVVGYIYITQNKNNSAFKHIAPYQQYLPPTIPYNPYYFNNSLYSVPGSTADPYMLYGAGYMPYESAVPAIDVIRAKPYTYKRLWDNNKKILPEYYKQYLRQNTTPFVIRD